MGAKHLVFRWSYVHPVTHKVVRAKNRPFPIWVNDETGEMELARRNTETTPEKAS